MTTKEANKKLRILLDNWIEKEVELIFHLRSGKTLEGKLLFVPQFNYIIKEKNSGLAVNILKHAVDYIERKPSEKKISF
ncbi:MAG TPA: hypothetical protein EYP21_00205 [Syntrophaceae bacterium]|nr:hypothetical protein [Syntrophaceae bacterium]